MFCKLLVDEKTMQKEKYAKQYKFSSDLFAFSPLTYFILYIFAVAFLARAIISYVYITNNNIILRKYTFSAIFL